MFWDSSAVIPVLIAEARSSRMVALLGADRAPALWWAGPVERAGRALAAHPLRAADAPAGEAFVCLDDRLREAAGREGFQVLPDVL